MNINKQLVTFKKSCEKDEKKTFAKCHTSSSLTRSGCSFHFKKKEKKRRREKPEAFCMMDDVFYFALTAFSFCSTLRRRCCLAKLFVKRKEKHKWWSISSSPGLAKHCLYRCHLMIKINVKYWPYWPYCILALSVLRMSSGTGKVIKWMFYYAEAFALTFAQNFYKNVLTKFQFLLFFIPSFLPSFFPSFIF